MIKNSISRNIGIKPLFVFNGLYIPHKSSNVFNKGKLDKRRMAWVSHESAGPTNETKALFRTAGTPTHSPEIIAHLIKYFRENNVEFIRAPYYSWAQVNVERRKENISQTLELISFISSTALFQKLAWLLDKKLIQAIIGGTENLIFMKEGNLITRFDPAKFSWCSKSKVVGFFKNKSFVDMCILAGFETFQTFPEAPNAKSSSFDFSAIVNLFAQNHSGWQVIATSFLQRTQVCPPALLQRNSQSIN